MIKRIDQLKGFGIYRNFQWGGLTDFAEKNLIYGWNYSGKTTLSRFFQILEKPERIRQWPGVEFNLSMNDGTNINHATLTQPLAARVFNKDFVHENFVQEYAAPAVFILGAQTDALRRRLKTLLSRRESVVRIEEKTAGHIVHMQENIDKLGTDKARDISTLLGDRGFKRPNLLQRVEEIRDDPRLFILTDEQATGKYEVCRSTTSWPPISRLQTSIPDFKKHAEGIIKLLGQTASNRAIIRLKENIALETWVREGLELHKENRKCEFCGAIIGEDRLAELKGHFSQEYENLVKEVELAIEHVKNMPLGIELPDERDFIPELKAEYSEIKKSVQAWLVWANGTQKEMVSALTEKQKNIETVFPWAVDLSRTEEIGKLTEKIEELIKKHGELIAELEQTKVNAKLALERHHAALFYQDNDLSDKQAQFDKFNRKKQRVKDALERIDVKIESIKQKLNQQSVGAAKLNELLRFLLLGDDIEVIEVNNESFEFRRGGSPAEKLSEGEKSAVAFAYFLTTLEADDIVLAETVIFVDDPICSLDSNHIYSVFALIKDRLEKCGQLFIATHSGELFNLLKDWLFSPREHYANNTKASAYYVHRDFDANNQWVALLENLPDLLRKYKSEYLFVFAQLYAFCNAPNVSLHEAYTAPNLLRKFLEAYLGFKKPCIARWSAKLDLILDKPEEQHEIQKFADDASHLQELSRSLQQPNFIVCAQRSVGMVINGLQNKDPDHFQSLCTVIGAIP